MSVFLCLFFSRLPGNSREVSIFLVSSRVSKIFQFPGIRECLLMSHRNNFVIQYLTFNCKFILGFCINIQKLLFIFRFSKIEFFLILRFIWHTECGRVNFWDLLLTTKLTQLFSLLLYFGFMHMSWGQL